MKLVTITTNSGKKVQVAQEAAGQFLGFLNDLEATGYKIQALGGYANRANVNNPKYKSKHSLGYAIDINPDKNPNFSGVSKEQRMRNPSKYTDMPIDTVRALAKKWSIGWGFDWKTISDAMHFSVAPNEGGKPLNLPIGGKAPASSNDTSLNTPTAEQSQTNAIVQDTTPQTATPSAVTAPDPNQVFGAPAFATQQTTAGGIPSLGYAILGPAYQDMAASTHQPVQAQSNGLFGDSLFANATPLFHNTLGMFNSVNTNGV